LVPDSFVDQVLQDWEQHVLREMERGWRTLDTDAEWLYQEAMSYLCCEVLENMDVAQPLLASISLLDQRGGGSYCEIVLAWSVAPRLDPGEVLDDCTVTRVIDIFMPYKRDFINNPQVRHDTVARWACELSAVADYLPQKEA
jgi:hypothetical protein